MLCQTLKLNHLQEEFKKTPAFIPAGAQYELVLNTDIFEWALVRSGLSGSVRMLAAGTLARRVKLALTTKGTPFLCC